MINMSVRESVDTAWLFTCNGFLRNIFTPYPYIATSLPSAHLNYLPFHRSGIQRCPANQDWVSLRLVVFSKRIISTLSPFIFIRSLGGTIIFLILHMVKLGSEKFMNLPRAGLWIWNYAFNRCVDLDTLFPLILVNSALLCWDNWWDLGGEKRISCFQRPRPQADLLSTNC